MRGTLSAPAAQEWECEMGFILKLIHGDDVLDLQSGRYRVDDRFRPPTTQRAVTYGNVAIGAAAVEKRRENIPWGFDVHIIGSSSAEVERALRDLQKFLNRSGDEAEPLYVAYRAWDDYDFEPTFGQFGAFIRYEVVHGFASSTPTPLTTRTSFHGPNTAVSLVIKPQSAGLEQASGQGAGGLLEDFIGTADGDPRGTIIAQATTNHFANPMFGHGTWDTGWTYAAGTGAAIIEQNTNPEYVLFGANSAKVSPITPSATTIYTETINAGVGTGQLSCYVKRLDGGVVSSSNLALYYAAVATTTYTAIGNGWYRLMAEVSTASANRATGIVVNGSAGSPFFVDAFQLEKKNDPTAFCFGDMLGCTWATTKHASKTTRTVAQLSYSWSDLFPSLTGWTIRVVWMPSDSEQDAVYYFFEDDGGDIAAFVNTAETISFSVEKATTIDASGQTFVAGTPMCLHFTYDGTNIAIYVNGSSQATGTDVAPTANPTLLYVGTDNTPTSHHDGTILGFATFPQAMTAAQVLADYNQVKEPMDDKQRIDPLPWRYTVDGDDVIDVENDGTDYNYMVLAGLMGDDLESAINGASSIDWILATGLQTGTLPVDQRYFDKDFLNMSGTNTLLFVDEDDGTVDASANAGKVDTLGIATTATPVGETAVVVPTYRVSRGLEVYGNVVMVDAGSDLQIRLVVTFGDEDYYSPWRSVSPHASQYRNFRVGPLHIPSSAPILDSERLFGLEIELKRTTGSANVKVSHGMYFFNHTVVNALGVLATGSTEGLYIRNRDAWLTDAAISAMQTRGKLPLMSRPIFLAPGKLNLFNIALGVDSYLWPVDYTFTISAWTIKPRWDIY
jgi:hypothetical protein